MTLGESHTHSDSTTAGRFGEPCANNCYFSALNFAVTWNRTPCWSFTHICKPQSASPEYSQSRHGKPELQHVPNRSISWDFEPISEPGRHQRVVWAEVLLNLKTERYLVKASHYFIKHSVNWEIFWKISPGERTDCPSESSFPSLSPNLGPFQSCTCSWKYWISCFDYSFHGQAWVLGVPPSFFKIPSGHK